MQRPNYTVLGIIFAVCVLLQVAALTTRYKGVYDGCPVDDLADCGPVGYEVQSLVGAFPVDWRTLTEAELDRYRVVVLVLAAALEIAVVATSISSRKKQA